MNAMGYRPDVYMGATTQKNKIPLYCPISDCEGYNCAFSSEFGLEGHLYRIHDVCGYCYFTIIKEVKNEEYSREWFLEKTKSSSFLEKMQKISFNNRRDLIGHCAGAKNHLLKCCESCFESNECPDKKVLIYMYAAEASFKNHRCKYKGPFYKEFSKEKNTYRSSLDTSFQILRTQSKRDSVNQSQLNADSNSNSDDDGVIFIGQRYAGENISILRNPSGDGFLASCTTLCPVMSSQQQAHAIIWYKDGMIDPKQASETSSYRCPVISSNQGHEINSNQVCAEPSYLCSALTSDGQTGN